MRENFPYFLLPNNCRDLVEKLNLTEEEHELLGLEILYCEEPTPQTRCSKPLRFLPFSYVEKHGSFKVMHMHETLVEKMGPYKDCITQFSIANPSKIFSLSDADDDAVLAFTKHIPYSPANTIGQPISFYEVIANSIVAIERMTHIENKKIPIYTTQSYNDGTGKTFWKPVGDGEKYAYRNNINFGVIQSTRDEHFVISDIFSEYFFIEKVESNSPEYLQQLDKYKHDLDFYQSHANMLNQPPTQPDFMGTLYLVLNEKGAELYEWYLTIGKDLNIFITK